LYQSKRFAYYRFWAKGLVKVPTFFRLAQNAYLQDLNFTASALLSFFKVTLRSAVPQQQTCNQLQQKSKNS
jgi:hypothetical protein